MGFTLRNMVYVGQGSPNKQISPTSLSTLQGRPILKAHPTSRSSDLPCFLFHKVSCSHMGKRARSLPS
jgi:hypothetical protein